MLALLQPPVRSAFCWAQTLQAEADDQDASGQRRLSV